MEIFDEKTYEKLGEEYQKALSDSTFGALKRALEGEMPFELKKQKSEMLDRCASLNNQLLNLLDNVTSQRAESVRTLLKLNKKELPDIECGEKIEILRYENPLIKIALELCLELEKYKNNNQKVQSLLARSYCILCATFSL